MKTISAEVTTQTSVGVKIGILVMMAAALTIAAGIIAGPKSSKKEPVVEEQQVVTAPSTVVKNNGPFASNQILVKFKPGVDQLTVINNVLSQPHTVTVDTATQDVIQEYQSKEYRIEETSLGSEKSLLSTTSSTSTEDFLALEYEDTTSKRIPITTETKQVTLALQETKQLFPLESDYETTKAKYPERSIRIPDDASPPQNIEGWQKIIVDQQADIAVLVDEFNALAEVEFAQPNNIYKEAVVPNDYFYNTSPPERNTPPKEDMWGLKEISIEKPWSLISGRGDIDEDGDIDGDDYNSLATMISTNGPYPDPITIVDVNNDNIINTADLDYLLNHINDPIQYPIFNYSDNEVIVAVSDTGVDYNHEDLADNIWVDDTRFGDVGAVTGVHAARLGNTTVTDDNSIYIAGTATNIEWRIEKRDLITGALVSG
ncbi:hypothetical protein IID19_05270, partial [Patescibacteria group bacterium]|nr:hypothetical protein [Patescibacteria group bacterium]